MTHAILGAGGIGSLIAALLAHSGEDVTLLVRPQSRAAQPDTIVLDRPSGQIVAPVKVATSLTSAVDVLWITVKATQLESALATISDSALAGSVVPLLNGIDHVARLRAVFDTGFAGARVVPATIGVEAERLAPGHAVQRSPFIRFAMAEAGRAQLEGIVEKLRAAGADCQFVADEATLLWNKLCFLAPFALATTASGMTSSEILADPQWSTRLRAAAQEACAVAIAEGAAVDPAKIAALHAGLPPGMRSSMQKDVAAHRAPELDAIAGPILRGGKKHGIATSVCQELVEAIQSSKLKIKN